MKNVNEYIFLKGGRNEEERKVRTARSISTEANLSSLSTLLRALTRHKLLPEMHRLSCASAFVRAHSTRVAGGFALWHSRRLFFFVQWKTTSSRSLCVDHDNFHNRHSANSSLSCPMDRRW